MGTDEQRHTELPSALPLWLKLGLRYGLGGAIALFLVYQMAVAQASDIKQLLTDHQLLKFYLRGICLNTASTEAQRLNCVPEGK